RHGPFPHGEKRQRRSRSFKNREAIHGEMLKGRGRRLQSGASPLRPQSYCGATSLATVEKAVLALLPIRRTVPITRTRITASITAYSAMSWPRSSDQISRKY